METTGLISTLLRFPCPSRPHCIWSQSKLTLQTTLEQTAQRKSRSPQKATPKKGTWRPPRQHTALHVLQRDQASQETEPGCFSRASCHTQQSRGCAGGGACTNQGTHERTVSGSAAEQGLSPHPRTTCPALTHTRFHFPYQKDNMPSHPSLLEPNTLKHFVVCTAACCVIPILAQVALDMWRHGHRGP